jgi:hypothetical protein
MNTVNTINNSLDSLSQSARRAVCFTLSVLIVSAGLSLGAVGANVAFQTAQAKVTTQYA